MSTVRSRVRPKKNRKERGLTTKTVISLIVFFVAVTLMVSCGGDKDQDKTDGPLKTAKELLQLHGLLGVQPEQRSEELRKREVDPKALEDLVADLDGQEKFLTDLYIGFVLGALARNQDTLSVSVGSSRARIMAGNLKIWFVMKNGRWKVSLSETVPNEVKKRALEEKAQLESRS